MREVLVTELVREVLGPRSGKSRPDTMDRDPYDEFITGILAPGLTDESEDDHQTYDDPGSATDSDEAGMQDDDRDAEPSDAASSTLNPKKRATAMGITFMVKTPGTVKLKTCITWARYLPTTSEDGEKWTRLPRWTVNDLELDPASGDETKPIDEFEGQEKNGAELILKTTVRKFEDGRYLVSAFLKNGMSAKDESKMAPSCVFQPQIRINSSGSTEICPMPAHATKYGSDDEMLDYLYRGEKVLARGHMVSAVWREIDPEGAAQNRDSGPPFEWADGDSIPEDTRRAFSPPEIRTEYVPLYQVPLPDLEWGADRATLPDLSAERLSDTWRPEKLREMLYPIYVEYSKWIGSIEAGDDPNGRAAVEECRKAAARIKDGLDMLTDPNHPRYDEDLVLSFCFANRAMLLSSQWSGRADFVYRPFQLAFLLMCLESVVNPESKFRSVCDLMWVPTGTGKTEAYLALAVLVFAYRRRISVRSGDSGAGVSVITRYTLRLLTTQQFRRTLSVVTAAESLRTAEGGGMPHGWRPGGHPDQSPLIWGSAQFSIGLWIGTSMTPNWFDKRLHDDGGKLLLESPERASGSSERAPDPAQVLQCPACAATLAVPEQGLEAGRPHVLHFVVKAEAGQQIAEAASEFASGYGPLGVGIRGCEAHASPGFLTVSLELRHDACIKASDIVHMWKSFERAVPAKGCSTSAARPGYFFTRVRGPRKTREFDFEVFCPNPGCQLRHKWCGGMPSGRILGAGGEAGPARSARGLDLPDGNAFMHVLEPFRAESPFFSDRTPIPALTCDYQVYARAPTVVIATSDKLARPPFQPMSASVFGNVDRHHEYEGYYRDGVVEIEGGVRVSPLRRPDLILQDELHLADGPLGSMMGMYESAVDMLCSGSRAVKYVACTATIRNATDQVKSLFNRGLQIFPPHGSDIHDRFFVRSKKDSVTDYSARGRMYVGICAPGRSSLTALSRIWSRLSQSVWEHRDSPDTDPYWTMVGYFNAIRELAWAISMYSQDIPNRMKTLSDPPRGLSPDPQELSSRTSSMRLHGMLGLLEKEYDAENPDASPDSLFTTSMFGTGIDISRLGLMYVHGQPKTVSSYIQATGRVGREKGGLVVTFCSAARARDLSHYEFFSRYHSQLHRFVEAPTVYPFSQALMDKALGPVAVFMLRNMRKTSVNWGSPDSAAAMASESRGADAGRVVDSIVGRIRAQPPSKQPYPEPSMIRRRVEECLEQWAWAAAPAGKLEYSQYVVKPANLAPVVLGDGIHEHAGVKTVYANAPQSLREVEEETTFGDP